MGQSTFPVPSSGSSTSTILPVNASSVILDGSLTSASTYTTTVNGNGGIAYLTATDNPATITVSGTAYTVPANTVVATTAVVGSGASVTVASSSFATTAPTAFSSTTMSFNPGSGWGEVAYGNGLWIACGAASTSYSYSTNGSTGWTTGTFSVAMTNVVYGNGYWVATGGLASSSANSLYSTNGTTWTAGTGLTSKLWSGMAYGAGKYLVMSGNTSSSTCAYSTNATSWSSMTMPSTQLWYGVAYGLVSGTGYWMAVAASNSNPGAYSTNGTTWTATTMPASAYWYGVAYGNGVFVATGSGVAIAYSTNGTTWNASGTVANAQSVCYGNGYFVAPGASSNTGNYSVNGTTWTNFTLTATLSWGSCAWGGGTYVVLNTASPGGTVGNYFTQASLLPVNFGIYAGPTTIN